MRHYLAAAALVAAVFLFSCGGQPARADVPAPITLTVSNAADESLDGLYPFTWDSLEHDYRGGAGHDVVGWSGQVFLESSGNEGAIVSFKDNAELHLLLTDPPTVTLAAGGWEGASVSSSAVPEPSGGGIIIAIGAIAYRRRRTHLARQCVVMQEEIDRLCDTPDEEGMIDLERINRIQGHRDVTIAKIDQLDDQARAAARN